LKIFLEDGAIMPIRAHEYDAGLDMFNQSGCTPIPPHGSACFNTGVHIEIPKGYAGFVKSKSGLNVKHGITVDGVIDSGYTGEIVVKLYNNSDERFVIFHHDKIAQLVILPVALDTLEEVCSLKSFEQSERGNNGFGSTGR